MAETAFQTQYRQEFIAGFEQHQSLLRDSCTTEAVIKGNTATFLVADSGSGTTAKTRGVNGLIPARADNLTQSSATLVEWHDLVRKTNFNIFASQGNQRAIMQMTTMAVVNRKVDSDILTQLATATNDTGASKTASLNLAVYAKTILGNNAVPFDGRVWAVISPAFEGYLLQVKEFGSADYVTKKPVESGETAWKDAPGYYNWIGVKWIVHPNLTGAGTATERCFMYHSDAIGHAVDTAGMESPVGYNEEQAYSWARCSVHMGSKLLQNSGIVDIKHDGSAFAAQAT